MVNFLNWQGETIDELESSEFKTTREFKEEQRRLAGEYAMAGMSGAAWSQHACNNWKD